MVYRNGGVTVQAMTRSEAADKLLDRYAGYYDISPAGEGQAPLVATCDFHAHSEKYVLSRKAKLWEAGSHEYVFVFSVPHLTEDIFNACRAYAYEHGMAKVEPGPNHMYSYITAMFLCDTCEKAAKKTLRRCRIYKSFKMAFWGWMDFHTGLAVLEDEKAFSNASGRSAAQLLKKTLFCKAKKKMLGKEKTL